jgi:phosphodiesterase/alkaline phosphatase D-like protein
MTRRTTGFTRRDAIARFGVALAATTFPSRLLHAAENLRFREDPFTLGVASGYPGPETVVLWTRIAPSPLQPGGGVPHDAVIPVTWEIAADERMSDVVRSGVDYATPQWAHSIHAEPAGLKPDRSYWYRFTAGGRQSPIGRTRTAPRGDAANARMRIAVASCQQYEHGYFLGYRHMLEDELDLILHVGDYIYETSWGQQRIRHHNTPEAVTRCIAASASCKPRTPAVRGWSRGTITKSRMTTPARLPKRTTRATGSWGAAPRRIRPITSTCRCRAARCPTVPSCDSSHNAVSAS